MQPRFIHWLLRGFLIGLATFTYAADENAAVSDSLVLQDFIVCPVENSQACNHLPELGRTCNLFVCNADIKPDLLTYERLQGQCRKPSQVKNLPLFTQYEEGETIHSCRDIISDTRVLSSSEACDQEDSFLKDIATDVKADIQPFLQAENTEAGEKFFVLIGGVKLQGESQFLAREIPPSAVWQLHRHFGFYGTHYLHASVKTGEIYKVLRVGFFSGKPWLPAHTTHIRSKLELLLPSFFQDSLAVLEGKLAAIEMELEVEVRNESQFLFRVYPEKPDTPSNFKRLQIKELPCVSPIPDFSSWLAYLPPHTVTYRSYAHVLTKMSRAYWRTTLPNINSETYLPAIKRIFHLLESSEGLAHVFRSHLAKNEHAKGIAILSQHEDTRVGLFNILCNSSYWPFLDVEKLYKGAKKEYDTLKAIVDEQIPQLYAGSKITLHKTTKGPQTFIDSVITISIPTFTVTGIETESIKPILDGQQVLLRLPLAINDITSISMDVPCTIHALHGTSLASEVRAAPIYEGSWVTISLASDRSQFSFLVPLLDGKFGLSDEPFVWQIRSTTYE